MKFDRVFRGYNPKQVDKYLQELEKKQNEQLASQRQRLDEFADENWTLRKQVEKYKADEEAISQSLVESQKLAEQTQNDAEKYSKLTLLRAKIFYAAWHAYSQTMVATLTDEEVKNFNVLKRKVEKLINSFDGGNVAEEAAATVAKLNQVTEETKTTNPIEKVEEAAHVIELEELIMPKESLGDLCRDLGLNVSDDVDSHK